MLLSLAIKNIQSHADTKIDFSNNITMFVGSGMSGKTAILRAINWVVNNTPNGTALIRDGEVEARVDMTVLSDGKTRKITRLRNKTENCYIIDDDIKNKLEANRGSVPEDVKNIINMSDINIQEQFFPHFLVFDSPGKIGQFINDVTGIGEIDNVVSYISSEIKKTSSTVAKTEVELGRLQTELVTLNVIDIELFNDCVETYKLLNADVVQYELDIQTLNACILSIVDVEHRITTYESIKLEQVILDISSALERVAKVEIHINECNTLEKILNDLTNIETLLVVSEITTPDINALITLFDITNTKIITISNIIRDITQTQRDIEIKHAEITAVEIELTNIKKKITVCPTCNQPLLTNDAKHAIGM